RGARDDPSIFSQVNVVLDSQTTQAVSRKEMFDTFYKHFKQQEPSSLGQLKDHACWMLSGSKGANRNKTAVREANDEVTIAALMKRINE
ncbi:MAG: hypothetical protein ACQESE_04490, partial [Nanobdellota archaeon]